MFKTTLADQVLRALVAALALAVIALPLLTSLS